jgi:alkylation response protein AidB-like acyl-CoA dehydrogenase
MTRSRAEMESFGYGEDESMIRQSVRRMLSERLPINRLSQLVAATPDAVYELGHPAAWDHDLWNDMADLGWSSLAIGIEDGGSDVNLAGIAGALEEVGRHALPSPLVATLCASVVLREAGGDVGHAWMTQIASKRTSATLAMTNMAGSWEPDDAPLIAHQDGEDCILWGSAGFVQEAAKSDVFVVSARQADRLLLAVVDRKAPGLRIVKDHIHDLTRDQAHIHFDEVRVGPEAILSTDGLPALRIVWPKLLVMIAADLCGASEWLLQTTVSYASQRTQFDRPIGFFQAVKHPLVNAMMGIDRARSLLYHACSEIELQSPNAAIAARMAKSAASDAAAFVSDRAIQLHGGIGFTWEYPLHLYFKRNLHNQMLFGDGTYQRRHIADALIGPIRRDFQSAANESGSRTKTSS